MWTMSTSLRPTRSVMAFAYIASVCCRTPPSIGACCTSISTSDPRKGERQSVAVAPGTLRFEKGSGHEPPKVAVVRRHFPYRRGRPVAPFSYGAGGSRYEGRRIVVGMTAFVRMRDDEGRLDFFDDL